MIPIDNLAAYDPADPIQRLYDSAMARSQDGQFDNLPKRARFYARHQVARAAIRRAPALDIAECGCWHGHSTLMFADLCQELGFSGRFSVFDSFEGLSDFQPADHLGLSMDEAETEMLKAHFVSDQAKLAALTAPYGFIDLYAGWIPSRFAEVADRRYTFVHIDVDLYEPTRDALAFFYPRLAEGGAIFFDDYGYKNFPGAQAAVDEVLAAQPKPPALFMHLPVGAAFLVK
jgi:hypothetical protein